MIDINYGAIPGAIALLFLLSFLYDRYVVGRIETSNPPVGVTAWEVVGGVGYTLFVAIAVFGLKAVLVLLALFAAAGIPMILGSDARHTARAG
jgi:hypothetical protein